MFIFTSLSYKNSCLYWEDFTLDFETLKSYTNKKHKKLKTNAYFSYSGCGFSYLSASWASSSMGSMAPLGKLGAEATIMIVLEVMWDLTVRGLTLKVTGSTGTWITRILKYLPALLKAAWAVCGMILVLLRQNESMGAVGKVKFQVNSKNEAEIWLLIFIWKFFC